MNKVGVILALCDFKIIGCLDIAKYRGAEHPWPNGWSELIAQHGNGFDQVEVDLLSDEMADAYIEKFKPSDGSKYTLGYSNETIQVLEDLFGVNYIRSSR